MLKDKGKVSVRQVMIMFILTVYTPAVRIIAVFASKEAKQAGWLIGIVILIVYLIVLYTSNKLFQKYKGIPFSEIINDITSKFIGKFILAIYAIWITVMLALYVRYYAERLVSSIYTNVEINVFIIVMLVLVSFILRSGIVVIARMSEIILIIITITIVILMAVMIPTIRIENLTPLTHLDIIPIFKGSIGTLGILYLPFLFFFNNEWSKPEEFLKEGIKAGLYIFVLTTLVILVTIGNMGYDFVSRVPLTLLVAVKRIILLDVISGLEALLVASWILTDFIIIIVFIHSAMSMFKSLFGLKDCKPLINIYLVITYLVTWILAYNVFELSSFSGDFAIYINIVLLIIIPILLFLLGKIRKKI